MESKKNPRWKATLLPLDVKTKIEFTSPTAITTGNSRYGEWMLFGINADGLKVIQGNETIDAYTGEAVTFISLSSTDDNGIVKKSKMWNKIFPKLSDGVMVFYITKKGKESKTGSVYTDFVVELEDGTVLE